MKDIIIGKQEGWRQANFVIPECEFYLKDGSCRRANIDPEHRYNCNEMWCEKKIQLKEKENNKNDDSILVFYRCTECSLEQTFFKLSLNDDMICPQCGFAMEEVHDLCTICSKDGDCDECKEHNFICWSPKEKIFCENCRMYHQDKHCTRHAEPCWVNPLFGYNDIIRSLKTNIKKDLNTIEDSIFLQMYNNILHYLDNFSQTITITPEFLNNLFHDHKKFMFIPIKKKYLEDK